MAIDWDELDIDGAIASSANKTDEHLASKISSLTRMTDEEVTELFPVPGDVKTFTELMKIVKSAEEQNNKVNKIIANGEDFAKVTLKLLEKFV